MKEGLIHFIADEEHFHAALALERAQAITDLIAGATNCGTESKSNAAYAVSDLLYDVAKRLNMDSTEGRTAPVLDLVNAIMAASDNALQAHRRARKAVEALEGKRSRPEVAQALEALDAAENASHTAYLNAVQIGAGLCEPRVVTP
jgi:hypothetical protein